MIGAFKGCILFSWDSYDPYIYKTDYHNNTSDTIELILIPHQPQKFIRILPGATYREEGSFGVDYEEDVIMDGLFSTEDNRYWNEISIRWHDSLMHTWYGPVKDLHDSIHSFFNKNSWDVTGPKPNETVGKVQFTIIESDLIENE